MTWDRSGATATVCFAVSLLVSLVAAIVLVMRIATFNVNGIRASVRRGFTDWLKGRGCDVVALQEVRCPNDALPVEAFGDYHLAYSAGNRAGRNGVALLTRLPPAAVRTWHWTPPADLLDGELRASGQTGGSQTDQGLLDQSLSEQSLVDQSLNRQSLNKQSVSDQMTQLPFALPKALRPFAESGRYIEVDLVDAPVRVASVYVPKGDTPYGNGPSGASEAAQQRYADKMAFLGGFESFLTRARRAAAADGRHYLALGDMNIAHTNLDLRNWRGNAKSSGFLPEERQWFDTIVSPRTLVDVVRALHPDEDGPYSWWTWRGSAFANDVGWRIDYHLASPALAKCAVKGGTDRDSSAQARLSDHAPVVVDYELAATDQQGLR